MMNFNVFIQLKNASGNTLFVKWGEIIYVEQQIDSNDGQEYCIIGVRGGFRFKCIAKAECLISKIATEVLRDKQ